MASRLFTDVILINLFKKQKQNPELILVENVGVSSAFLFCPLRVWVS